MSKLMCNTCSYIFTFSPPMAPDTVPGKLQRIEAPDEESTPVKTLVIKMTESLDRMYNMSLSDKEPLHLGKGNPL